MAELSPAARAVLEAMHRSYDHESTRRAIAADILRAVADQVVNPDDHEPVCVFEKDYWDYGFSAAVETIRGTLLAIAAELEGRP